MRRLLTLVFLFASLLGSFGWAQDPRITVTADQEEVVVGQPYLLRIEVLVPTFMPSAPVFPTFEMPGLIVRLPEKSTLPVSEKIDGDTWSGVTRTYRIYPTRAGEIEISAQTLSLVYKNTDTNEDVSLTVDVPATTIRATVPQGARALDPLIIAQEVTIDQSWQVAEGALAVGDAVVRALDISVDGASALFVPPLLDTAPPRSDSVQPEDADAEALPFLAYPEDAKVTEKIERGVMSGTRHEQVSYIAQAGGGVVFPDITLRWYNIETNGIEEIVLKGRSVEVAMPPVERTPPDPATILRWVIIAGLLAVLAWGARRILWPPLAKKYQNLQMRYAATANAVHRNAAKQAKARNLNGVLTALDERTRRGYPVAPDLAQAIRALTQKTYSDDPASDEDTTYWPAIQSALRADQPRVFVRHAKGGQDALPALNPFTQAGRQTISFKEQQ
ncbi:BatD family protein [Tateyamaria pelophila]|uniref:BatD family protein n=1 Tax=Tateyamaria pelophila TaxID=328415 RepID=UPI001CBC179D|nr:BatD family protein [Tateyamaria pelophila]